MTEFQYAPKRTLSERVLAVCGGNDAPFAVSALRSFQQILLTCMAIEAWNGAHQGAADPLFTAHLAAAFVLTMAAGISFSASMGRAACAAGLVATAFEWFSMLPLSANHHYLAMLCLGLLLLPSRNRSQTAVDEAVITLRALRWVAVIGLAAAGLQKLMFGYWFKGEALAYAISQRESFATLLGIWLPSEEVQRLSSLQVGLGVGPFRVQSWWLIAISNLTWLSEILFAIFLIVPRSRRVTVLLTLAFLVLVQLGAREIFFGGLMAGLVTLAWPGNLLRRLLPLFLIFYGYVLATLLELVPHWSFT